MQWAVITRIASGAAKALLSPLKRLYQEGQAVRGNRNVKIDALGRQFDITYGHLIHYRPDEADIAPIVSNALQELVSTPLIQSADVQVWLNKPDVKDNFFILAKAYLANPDGDLARKRKAFNTLKNSCPPLPNTENFTTLARKICSALVTGPTANMNAAEDVILGVTQQGVAATEKVQQTLDTHLNTRASLQAFQDKEVINSLKKIIITRGALGANELEEIESLVGKISQDGELAHCSSAMKLEVYYWGSRIFASRNHENKAEACIKALQKINPTYDVRLPKALLINASGNRKDAVKLLNEINTPESRTFINAWLSESERLKWYSQIKDKYPSKDLFLGRGWGNLLATYVEQDRENEAYQLLSSVPLEAYADFPELHYVTGLIYAASLLPMELRKETSVGRCFCPGIDIAMDPQSAMNWEQAILHLQKAKGFYETYNLNGRALFTRCWLAWLLYRNPKSREDGLNEIQRGLSNSEEAHDFLNLCIQNDIPFDIEQQEKFLKEREIIGTFGAKDYASKIALLYKQEKFQELLEFLDRNKAILIAEIFDERQWAYKKIDAHLELKQFAQAENLLFEYQAAFGSDFAQIQDKVRAAKGEPIHENLIQRYEADKSDTDLINLCNALSKQKDFPLLEKYTKILFEKHRSTENAGRYIAALWYRGKHPDIVEFVSSHMPEVSNDRRALQSYAWSLFYTGKFQESLAICKTHLQSEDTTEAVTLKINLALFSGDWEQFPEILNAEQNKLNERNPVHLIQLAQISADQDVNKAIEFLKLAVSKAPDDPKILINAYSLAVQYGREEEGNDWFKHVLEVQKNEDIIKTVPFEETVEFIKRKREQQKFVGQQLEKAECGYTILCDQLGQTLSAFFISQAKYNEIQADPRNRTPLLTKHGGKKLHPLDEINTVTIDIGSLLILSSLELLDSFFSRFTKIVVPWHTMPCLLTDIRQSKYHQPSKVRDAKILRDLLDDKKITFLSPIVSPPKWLIEEIGDESAYLLEAAKQASGFVILPGPLYKAGSNMKKLAELGEYEAYICACKTFTDFLNSQGVLDKRAYERAQEFLSAHNRWDSSKETSIENGQNIYLSDVALSYFASCGILQLIRPSGITIHCHEESYKSALALIRTESSASEVTEQIQTLRRKLKNAYLQGKVAFLPEPEKEIGPHNTYIATQVNIVSSSKNSEAVWIDDRFFNKHQSMTHPDNAVSPIIGILDFLHDLKKRGLMQPDEFMSKMAQLRAQGHVIFPVLPEELLSQLQDSYNPGTKKITEKHGLKSLKENILMLQASDILKMPEESNFLMILQQAVWNAFYKIWNDKNIPDDEALIKSEWILFNIFPSIFHWKHTLTDTGSAEDLQKSLAQNYDFFLKPFTSDLERQKTFSAWFEQNIIQPIAFRNPQAVLAMAEIAKTALKDFFDESGPKDT